MTDSIDRRLHDAARDLAHGLVAEPPAFSPLLRRRRTTRVAVIGVVAVLVIGAALLVALERPRPGAQQVIAPPGATGWVRRSMPLTSAVPVQTASDGDRTVGLTLNSSGVVTSFVIGIDGEVQLGQPLTTGRAPERLSGVRLIHTHDGWLGILQGTEGPGRTTVDDAMTIKSTDGLHWTASPASGLDRGIITGLVVTSHGIVAVGVTASGTPGHDFSTVPHSWLSEDGVHWKDVMLPAPAGGQATPTGVVWSGDRLWAVGNTDAGPVVWVGDLDGSEWSPDPEGVTVPPVGKVGEITTVPEIDAVAIEELPAAGGRGRVYESEDGFRTWSLTRGLPDNAPGGDLIATSNRLFTFRIDNTRPAPNGQTCAGWKSGCPIGPREFFVTNRAWRSGDAITWSRIDTSGAPGSDDADAIAARHGNGVSLLRFGNRSIDVWTWTGSGDVPTLPD